MYNISVHNKFTPEHKEKKMKKLLILALMACICLTLAACGNKDNPPACEHIDENFDGVCDKEGCGEAVEVDVLTHAEYMEKEIDDLVVIESYVQGKQSWYEDKATLYLQSPDGAYFVFEAAVSEAQYAELEVGTKVRVYGYKAEWDGEIEIVDAKLHVLEGDTFVAEPADLTALLGTDELAAHQNELGAFVGLTVKEIAYKNGEPGDDIYVTFTLGEKDYSFCVERYLTDPDSEVYTTVGTLEAGDVVYVEGFVYWYNGVNTHITRIVKMLTNEEYDAAKIDDAVCVKSYVQGKQSWWDNKATLYLQSPDGAYFVYELACTEAQYAELTVGTAVVISGYKAEWGGEVEIVDGEILAIDKDDTYVAEAVDLTALLGTDELIAHQNELAKFLGLTVEEITYKNGEPGDDIYVTLTLGEGEYSFCVERYLTDPNSEVYHAFTEGLIEVGDVVNVEGFVYWYNGVNTHITAIESAAN